MALVLTTCVRDGFNMAVKEQGLELAGPGQVLEVKGIDSKLGEVLIEVDPGYFRPAEVDLLLGDSAKARKKLGWEPKYDLQTMVKEMVARDLEEAKKAKVLKDNGYKILVPQEA